MATFDEKEFLWEEMYSSVTAFISRKKDLKENFSQEMLDDFRILELFRREIGKKNHEEIDFDEAMSFYKSIEDKYKSIPDKW